MRPLLGRFHEQAYALLRIVIGFLFACHGSQALLNFPPGEPHELPPFFLFGKVLELVLGLLVLLGFQTSIAAFLASGEMAVAYFMAHARGGFFPIVNHGEPAVMYCFVFLYMAAKGSGILVSRRAHEATHTVQVARGAQRSERSRGPASMKQLGRSRARE